MKRLIVASAAIALVGLGVLIAVDDESDPHPFADSDDVVATRGDNDDDIAAPLAPAAAEPSVGGDYDPANFTLEGTPIPASSAAEPSGNFRTSCNAGHLAYDDPIVQPGQPGLSHLHQFFGNLGTNASSTYESLLGSGNSTCDGGPINRSGYWVPALINTTNNSVVIPDQIIVYYKGEPAGGVTKLPPGLRMVAGYDMATGTVSNGGVAWQCESNGYADADTIGTCSGELIAIVRFPHCWDGENLDSSDHRSHMATAANNGWGTCPPSHPVVIPRISYHVHYDVVSSDVLELSSDVMPGMTHPGGQTLHGDWFGAWNTTFSDRWFAGCLLGLRNCNPGNPGTQLGDGGQLINAHRAVATGAVAIPPNG